MRYKFNNLILCLALCAIVPQCYFITKRLLVYNFNNKDNSGYCSFLRLIEKFDKYDYVLDYFHFVGKHSNGGRNKSVFYDLAINCDVCNLVENPDYYYNKSIVRSPFDEVSKIKYAMYIIKSNKYNSFVTNTLLNDLIPLQKNCCDVRLLHAWQDFDNKNIDLALSHLNYIKRCIKNDVILEDLEPQIIIDSLIAIRFYDF